VSRKFLVRQAAVQAILTAYPEHGIISKKNQRLFKAWDKEDPVDVWECERCKRIEQIQGNDNPFVKNTCVNSGMW